MSYYKYDTHVHTSETSPCGKVDAKTLVRLYKKAGYHGIVITDHYYMDYFNKMPYDDWNRKVDEYLTGYYTALEEGKKTGLKVLFGIELRFTENGNEFLVFGLSPDFLYSNPRLYEMDIRSFRQLTANTPILVYQAHPFRANMIPVSPEFIDGIEIYNGNPRHNSNNDKAYDYAAKNGLKMVSGSDFHQMQDTARGGIVLSEAPENSFELAELLRNNRVVEFIAKP